MSDLIDALGFAMKINNVVISHIPSFVNRFKLKSLETYKKIIVYKFLYELNKSY